MIFNGIMEITKKIKTLKQFENFIDVPYETRAKIVAPIINKLIDEKITNENLVDEYKKEKESLKVVYEEF